jgi:protein-disulfide isomerase
LTESEFRVSSRYAQEQAAERRRDLRRAHARHRQVFIAGSTLTVFLMVAGSLVFLFGKDSGSQVPAGATSENGYALVVQESDVQGAPVIQIYQDFQCPTCRDFEVTYGDAVASVAREVSNVTVLRYPLSTSGLGDDVNASAQVAAAAGCAADEGKVSEFTKVAFDLQRPTGQIVPESEFQYFAATIGASDKFMKCVKSGRYANWATSMIPASAEKAGIEAAPRVLVNGEPLPLDESFGQTLAKKLTAAYEKAGLRPERNPAAPSTAATATAPPGQAPPTVSLPPATKKPSKP